MHNLDFSFPNYESAAQQYGHEFEATEQEWPYANEWEADPNNEWEEPGASEWENGAAWEFESYDNEYEDETALAAELLGVQNEQELDQFLGKLKSKFKKFANSSLGQKVMPHLKSIAKVALPKLAQVAGGFLGGPAGAAIAGNLAQKASNLLGLELEGLSAEDQEFEVARRYVQFANEVMAQSEVNSEYMGESEAAKQAVQSAAQSYMPGLLAPASGARPGTTVPPGHRSTGRGGPGGGRTWVRQGRHLLVLNVFARP